MTEIRKGQMTRGDQTIDVIEIWQEQMSAAGFKIKVLVVCVPVEPDELISVVM